LKIRRAKYLRPKALLVPEQEEFFSIFNTPGEKAVR